MGCGRATFRSSAEVTEAKGDLGKPPSDPLHLPAGGRPQGRSRACSYVAA